MLSTSDLLSSTTTMQGKKDLDDLPDEVIQIILRELAPQTSTFAEAYCNEYVSDLQMMERYTLRALRLVNKRLSRLAKLEQLRAPHAAMESREALSYDHMDVIYDLLQHQELRAISLAGQSTFFASLFKLGFRQLTWLRLHFAFPAVNHVPHCILESMDFDDSEIKWVNRLREQISGIPLEYLELCFTAYHSFDCPYLSGLCTLLAAGHPTLRTLAFDGDPRAIDFDDDEVEAVQSYRSALTNLSALQLHDVTEFQLKLLLLALGDLPLLSNLAILKPLQSPLLDIMADNIAHSILHLQYKSDHDTALQAFVHLPRFQGLISLELELSGLFSVESLQRLESVSLPNLQTVILSPEHNKLQLQAVIFQWALRKDLLPSLRSLMVGIARYSLSRADEGAVKQILTKYASLIAHRSDLHIEPMNFKQIVESRL